MDTCACHIAGGEFEKAGEASSLLKESLKRIGVEPELTRRVVIAAYEAEMNVVIHAHRGRMEARIAPDRVEVEIADDGPGIPDIAQAMKEGYSTAPPEARALGFGAGMGLPNIKRCADEMSIESVVGKGTRLHFTVRLKGSEDTAQRGHGLELRRERCNDCRLCLKACPTEALRVRRGWPFVLEHLCIGCNECIRACPTGAIGIRETARQTQRTAIVLPGALIRTGGEDAPTVGLRRYRRVAPLDAWHEAVRRTALRSTAARPVIIPTCAAVVALIESRYPALLGNLAPVASPVESAAEQLAGDSLEIVVSCPAEALLAEKRVSSVASAQAFISRPGTSKLSGGKTEDGPIRPITGLAAVMRTLEEIEDGRLGDSPALELMACDGGCPMLGCSNGLPPDPELAAIAAELKSPRAPRPGVRLDKDMAEAIRKLGRMDELVRTMPGDDCGLCGAPTCRALAEDVVTGRAVRRDCPRLHNNEEDKK